MRNLRLVATSQKGFTLVELLVVMAILVLLAVLALPAYASITERARHAKSLADLHRIEEALERYRADKGHYPRGLINLVEAGYLQRNVTFQSPWYSEGNRVWYFYAVDQPGTDAALAFALGDPGPHAVCGQSNPRPAVRLDRDPTHPLPCGRHPKDNQQPAWVFLGTSATLILDEKEDQTPWASLQGYRSDLRTE